MANFTKITTRDNSKLLAERVSSNATQRHEAKNILDKTLKSMIFLSVALITGLYMFETEKPVDGNYFLVAWNTSMVTVMMYTAWNLSKFVFDSNNNNFINLFVTSSFLGYFIIAWISNYNFQISSYAELIKIVYWAIPGLLLPILSCLLSSFNNRNISPILSKIKLMKALSNTLFTISMVLSYYYAYKIYFTEQWELKNFTDSKQAWTIVATILSSIVGTLINLSLLKNFKGILVASVNKDKIKIVLIPFFIVIATWFIYKTWAHDYYGKLYVFAALILTITILTITYIVFAKGELKSPSIAVTWYGTGITSLWILIYIFTILYGYQVNRFQMVSLSTMGTIIIVLVIAIYDDKFTKFQTVGFASMIFLLTISLVVYWFIQVYIETLNELPFDLDSFLLMTFAVSPTLFLLTGVISLFVNQVALNKHARSERRIIKSNFKSVSGNAKKRKTKKNKGVK